MRYILEIYDAGGDFAVKDEALARYEVNQPFMAFNVGDIMHPIGWVPAVVGPDHEFMIEGVEHIVSNVNQPTHQILVYVKLQNPREK